MNKASSKIGGAELSLTSEAKNPTEAIQAIHHTVTATELELIATINWNYPATLMRFNSNIMSLLQDLAYIEFNLFGEGQSEREKIVAYIRETIQYLEKDAERLNLGTIVLENLARLEPKAQELDTRDSKKRIQLRDALLERVRFIISYTDALATQEESQVKTGKEKPSSHST